MADYNEEESPKEDDSDKDILEDAKKYLKECVDEEASERSKMMDDLRFCTLDQWPPEVRKERENDLENGPRPCLTIDKINQYIVQVSNDMKQGKPGINVRPQDDQADVDTAKVLKGLIRNIEDQSNADIAYGVAGESACKIGMGYFRITTEYVSEDSFDQDIFIKPIPNTFSTYLGPHIMPDGSDAKYGFIMEHLPVETFKEQYPGKKWKDEEFDDLGESFAYWKTKDTVTVVEYFCIEETPNTIHYLADGTTISDGDYSNWPEEAGAKPTSVDQRTTTKKKVKWAKLTGAEVLDKRDLPGKYIPIVEVVGRESHIEGKRILWGLVRPAKDSLRMYNYFASTITEKMGLAPKAPFVGAKGQFEGLEDKWKKANRTNYAYLEYNPIDVNGNALPRPERQGPTPMEAALLHQMQVIEHDVQTSLGMFKAAVGETESQQSGRALLALQRESDTGTYHFGANLGISIRHCGRIILDWIPTYYDTKRIVRILGEDGTVQTAHLDPSQQQAKTEIKDESGAIQRVIHNPLLGKYDVSITVGPSYNTKRMEAAATLTEVVKTQPQLMPLIGDLLFRSLDFPYSDQIAERMKKMLPPPLQDQANPEQQVMVLTQKVQQMGQVIQQLGQENQQLKSGAQVKMMDIQATAAADAEAHKLKLAQANDEMNLKQQQAQKDAEFQVWEARLKAATAIEVAEINSKTSLTQAALQAETDANIELSKAMTAEPGQENVTGTDKKATVKPLDKIGKMHSDHMQKMTEMMGVMGQAINQHAQNHQQVMEHLTKTKTIRLGGVSRSGDGSINGASATVQ